MFKAVRSEITERLAEVFQLIEHIRTLEAEPPDPDPVEVKILRGLFYVHLYAAFELAVNKSVQCFLQGANALNVAPLHFHPRFFSVALESEFSSIRNVGEEKRWSARVQLIDKQAATDVRPINGDIFGLYLQNVWVERLEVLFRCLNIEEPIVPDPTFRLYIDEMVEKRNGVAHGRFSAQGVGSVRRSNELMQRYNAVGATCSHVIDCFDAHHTTRGLILEAHRPLY